MSTRQQSSSQRSSSYSSTKLTSLSHSIQATDVYMSLDDGRICKKSDHKKPKNCIDNVFCVHHIHKMDEGIWHTEQTRFMNQCIPVNRIAQHRHDMQRPVGLTNLGATCYLNVLMQTLFQTIPIRNAIYAMDAATCEGQGTSVVQSLQNTFSFMHTSEQLLFSLASFTDSLGLNKYEQQDPQEFNKLFLDKVDSFQIKSEKNNGISSHMQGTLKYINTCQKCRHESIQREQFLELGLNVEKCRTLQASIDKYFTEEHISGYDCGECNSKQNAVRTISIEKSPNVLFLQLLRYVYDKATFEKKKLMSKYTFPDNISIGGCEYKLSAVLYHKGRSAYGGHYVCEVLNWKSLCWWLCDDESVIPTTNPSSGFKGGINGSENTDVEVECVEIVDTDQTAIVEQLPKRRRKNKDSVLENLPGQDSLHQDNDKGKREKKESQDMSPTLRSQSAYMLAYVKVETLTTFPHEPPKHIMRHVIQKNEAFRENLQEYISKVERLQMEIQCRKDTYSAVEKQLSVEDMIGPHQLLPRVWLKSWITGTSYLHEKKPLKDTSSNEGEELGVVDLTGGAMDLTDSIEGVSVCTQASDNISVLDTNERGVFKALPELKEYYCRHGVGICPSKIKDFKAISDTAYQMMMSTLSEHPENVFNTENARCGECNEIYANTCQEVVEKAAKYKAVSKLIEKAPGAVSCVLSKSWVTQFRRVMELQLKEAGSDPMVMEACFASSTSNLSALSKAVLKLDHRVNAALCCVHNKLKHGFRRSAALVSIEAWTAILECFPAAIGFRPTDSVCSECLDTEREEDENKDMLIATRDQRMDETLDKLSAILKRRSRIPHYPVDFERPDYLTKPNKERYALIDSKWLRSWFDHLLHLGTPPPGALLNTGLRCVHGGTLIPPAFALLSSGVSPGQIINDLDIETAGSAEIIKEKEWESFLKFYDPRLPSIEDSEEMEPFCVLLELTREGVRWSPEPCTECINRIRSESDENRKVFLDAELKVVIVESVEDAKAGGIQVGEESHRRRHKRNARGKASTLQVVASSSDNLGLLKMKIYEIYRGSKNVSMGSQKLYFQGEEMIVVSKTLQTYGIKAGDVVYLVLGEEGVEDPEDLLSGWEDSRQRLSETGFAACGFLSSHKNIPTTNPTDVASKDEGCEVTSSLATIIEMGYTKAKAMSALEQSEGNVSDAICILLDEI